MRADRPIPPRANDNTASPPAAPPRSDWYKLIIGRCMAFARPTILGLLMVIFLAIPTGTPPELGLNPGSSLWSLNISTSHSKLITVEYSYVKLLSSFDGQLSLSRPSLVSTFTQDPGCVTSVRAKAQSTLAIVTDLGVNGLVSMLSGAEVTIDVVVKAKRRLCLGPWWVAVFDVDVSFAGSTFTAPTNGEGSGSWMILGGTLSCSLDIIPQLCQLLGAATALAVALTGQVELVKNKAASGMGCSRATAVSFLTLYRILRGRLRRGRACGAVRPEEVRDENVARRVACLTRRLAARGLFD